MPNRDITWLVEQYALELCRSHPSLKGLPMRHKDDRQKPQPTCLTFSATKGNDLQGLRTSEVELEVKYRGAESRSPQQNSLAIDAIDECFSEAYAQRGLTTVENEMQGVWMLTEKKTSDRQDTKNFRRFVLTIPFRAGKA